MKIIQVSAEHSYQVKIGGSWSTELISLMQSRSKVAVIISESFSPDLTVLQKAESDIHVFKIPDGEAGKSIASLTSVWNWLGAVGFTRSDLIVGIGGGAVTDLAGFVSATWLRGVDWIAVPTSLAAMVDAAVGGKTGINSEYGKNLIGAFYSPIAVVVDPSWLGTLSDRDFAAGMAEVIKCGFIVDTKILELVRGHTVATLRTKTDTINELITRTIQVKAEVVSTDFKESFAREVLNYGHTLGHAIEIQAKFSLRHGEAVAIGLVYAAELAAARGLLSQSQVALHRELLSGFGLPISYQRAAWQYLRPLLALDKKTRGATIRFVALSDFGVTVRLADLTSDELDRAYERISA